MVSLATYKWCANCKVLFANNDRRHETHEIKVLGEDLDDTVLCLDELIEYGLSSLQNMEADLETARNVKKEIENTRQKFMTNLHKRIEMIVRDIKVALEDQAMLLMNDVENKIVTMEANATDVIRKSNMKIDTAKQFIQRAAIVLPDDQGDFQEKQLRDLYNFYKSLEKVNLFQSHELSSVEVNIKYPNTMKTKTECRNLAKSVIGEIENNKRETNLINSRRASIDVVHVKDFEGITDPNPSKIKRK